MIVDLVRNDLGRVCSTGTVTVPGLLEVESHPGLVHLVSTVAGDLRPGTTWPQILAATFPPGSVTGAPKLAALDIIRALEAGPRGPYCGAFGWVDADAGTAELAVAIRTFWREDTDSGPLLAFGTGAGITWDSDARAEWRETMLKAARLARGRRRSGGAVKFWVAGGLVPAEQAAVAVLDHGFTVGDGVFETLKTVNDPSVGVVPFAMDRHVARLSRSAAGMGIAMPDPDDAPRRAAGRLRGEPGAGRRRAAAGHADLRARARWARSATPGQARWSWLRRPRRDGRPRPPWRCRPGRATSAAHWSA